MEDRDRVVAYLKEELEPEEAGKILFLLWGNAMVVLGLYTGLAAVVGVSLARVWRQRGDGIADALRYEVSWSTIAGTVGLIAAQRLVSRRWYQRLLQRATG